MRVDVLLPQWGMGMSEGTVIQWLKGVGERIVEGEPLVEIEAAKVNQEMESPASGTLVEIHVQVGETVSVRSLLAVIEQD